MGRHFCVSEGNLYIFTTGGEFLLDLNVFPGELNLFEAEVGWKLSPWIAVAEDVLQRSVDRASIILQLNDYSYMQVSSGLLEDYFRDGDESHVLLEAEERIPLVVRVESGES